MKVLFCFITNPVILLLSIAVGVLLIGSLIMLFIFIKMCRSKTHKETVIRSIKDTEPSHTPEEEQNNQPNSAEEERIEQEEEGVKERGLSQQQSPQWEKPVVEERDKQEPPIPGIPTDVGPKPLVKNGSVQHYFHSEAMVTAGPRKNVAEDIAFGEDTCGIVQTRDKVLFWLLDGTSNQNNVFRPVKGSEAQVEVFSSRLMVQSIANTLPIIFRDNPNVDAKSLAQRAIKKVTTDWISRYEAQKESVLGGAEILKCGTTMIVGILDISGYLDAFVVGDSSLLLFDSHQNFKSPIADTGTNQEFIATISQNQLCLYTGQGANGYRAQGAMAKGLHVREHDVWFVVCHSDGIGSRRSEMIQKRKKLGFEALRKSWSQIPINTQDDKSLLVVEITNL